MLGRVYRFLTEQRLFHGGFPHGGAPAHRLLPGTFDPFTLSHKGIVRAISDRGFEVLLAIDEFSLVQADPALPHPPPHAGPCPWPMSSMSTSFRELPGEHRQSREPPPPAWRAFPRAAGVHRGGQRRGGPASSGYRQRPRSRTPSTASTM